MAYPPSSEASHGAQEHHGSWWPIILTIGTTLFLVGLVDLPGIGRNPLVWGPGLLILLGSVWGWIREDVHELKHAPYAVGGSPYFYGTIVLILSELVIFGILFFFYFWSRGYATVWPDPHIAHMDMTLIYVNTAILFSSGFTVHMAQHALEHDKLRKFQAWLAATVVLGTLFLIGQAYEYYELAHEGFTPQLNTYATAFFSLTGVHGLHVLAGVVVLATILGLSFTGFITKERVSGAKGAFYYWHFVDLVWVFVLLIVYIRVI